MRIRIAAVGRMKSGPERDLAARYLERAIAGGRALGLTGFDVAEISESRASNAAARKAEEAKSLLDVLPEGVVMALDEHGKSMGSEALAQFIAKRRDDGRPAMS